MEHLTINPCPKCGTQGVNIKHVQEETLFHCTYCGFMIYTAGDVEDGLTMWNSYAPKDIYWCDPEKNKECGKQGCYINGGPCERTTKKEYRREEEC